MIKAREILRKRTFISGFSCTSLYQMIALIDSYKMMVLA